MSKKKHTKKPHLRRFFEIGLIAVAIIVLIFIVSFSIQITQGIAKETTGPAYNLRIEILNAGAENGTEKKLADYLNGLDSPEMEIDIVQSERFTMQPSKETFIISRTKESQAIKELAKILDIDSKKIQYGELTQNKKHLNATIIIGKDSVIEALLVQSKELE